MCCCVNRISLEVMTLNPVCENVETSEGVPLTVTGVAQVKVMTEPELLSTACEQFLGKAVQHIERVILQTMEGHLRAILGTVLFLSVWLCRFAVMMQNASFLTTFPFIAVHPLLEFTSWNLSTQCLAVTGSGSVAECGRLTL